MPVLIIQTNDDGSVSIAAPAQVPPELMADSEVVENLEQAAQVLQEVLAEGYGPAGGAGGQDPNATGGAAAPTSQAPNGATQPSTSAQDAPPSGGQPTREDDMEAGFRNVRGRPR